MKRSSGSILLKPIGFVHTDVEEVPRHWTLSSVEGKLVIEDSYLAGMKDIRPGQRILVIFHFHESPEFTPRHLTQTPPHRDGPLGVFSICSPVRPNPIGASSLEVLDVRGNAVHVRGLDMRNGTPILDIKPLVEDARGCPSCRGPDSAPSS